MAPCANHIQAKSIRCHLLYKTLVKWAVQDGLDGGSDGVLTWGRSGNAEDGELCQKPPSSGSSKAWPCASILEMILALALQGHLARFRMMAAAGKVNEKSQDFLQVSAQPRPPSLTSARPSSPRCC